eukprot:9504167-Pyramimonas_sp.AAC.1
MGTPGGGFRTPAAVPPMTARGLARIAELSRFSTNGGQLFRGPIAPVRMCDIAYRMCDIGAIAL